MSKHSKHSEIQPAPAPVPDLTPDCLSSLVRAITEDWEAPDPDQFEHAYQSYLETLLDPIEAHEEVLSDKQVEMRSLVQRMIEIAPEFFERALRRTPFETGYFIERENSDVR